MEDEGWIDGLVMDGWMDDGWMDRWMDGWMDGWIDDGQMMEDGCVHDGGWM